MEFPDHVVDWEEQPNSYGNEERQLGGARNKSNPLNSIWTKDRLGRNAAVLRSLRRKCPAHSGSCSDAAQRAT